MRGWGNQAVEYVSMKSFLGSLFWDGAILRWSILQAFGVFSRALTYSLLLGFYHRALMALEMTKLQDGANVSEAGW